MSERDAAIVREVTALIVEAEQGVRELYPRLYEQMEADGGATCLTTRQLREAIARGEAAGEVSPGTAAECPLRERYAEVINQSTEVGRSWTEHDVADAVVAVRDDVLAETEWMRDHWERCFIEANGSAADALRGLSVAETEIARLREANTRLNRRATDAEAVAVANIDTLARKGQSLGRGLANVGYGIAVRERDEARAELARLREALAKVEALCRWESRKADVHKDKCLLTVGQVRAALASVPAENAGDREPASEGGA